MDSIDKFKGYIALATGVVNEAGGLPDLSTENRKRNNSAFRHVAQQEPEHVAMEFIVDKKREDKIASLDGITTFDSHVPDDQVLAYIEKPKGNKILLDGRVVDPKGHTIRYWKYALLEEGVEPIEMI